MNTLQAFTICGGVLVLVALVAYLRVRTSPARPSARIEYPGEQPPAQTHVNISWQPREEDYRGYVSGHFATDEEREQAGREYAARVFVNDLTGSTPASEAAEDREHWFPTGPKKVPLRDDPWAGGNNGLKPLTDDDLRRMGLRG